MTTAAQAFRWGVVTTSSVQDSLVWSCCCLAACANLISSIRR
jgi:hypothetical protein